MSYLVVLIIDNPDDCPAVLDAWEQAGAPGVTILESTGLGRMRRAGLEDDMPLMPSLEDFLGVREVPHRTVFSVVESEDQAERLAQAAQEVIGDLDEPHTGFLYILPVLKAYGLGRAGKEHHWR
jgi:nitrogen regulatory protein PII